MAIRCHGMSITRLMGQAHGIRSCVLTQARSDPSSPLDLRELIGRWSTARAIEGKGFITVLAGELFGPFVERVAPDSEFQRKLGSRFLPKLEQPYGRELEFLRVGVRTRRGFFLGLSI